MPIQALPPAPSRANDTPSVFQSKADALLSALVNLFVGEANALEANVNAKELSATTQAGNAATSAAAAATHATTAGAARDAALATANATLWVSGTNYAVGVNVISPANMLTYRRKTAGAGATDPSLDSANWVSVALAAPDVQAQTATSFTTAGTGTAYTGTPSPAITAHNAGLRFCVTFHADSGDNPTIQINGRATPPQLVKMLPNGTFANIKFGDIKANMRSDVLLLGGGQAWVMSLPIHPSSGYFKLRTWGAANIAVGVTDAATLIEHLEAGAIRAATVDAGLNEGWTCTIVNGPGASNVTIAAGAGETLVQLGTGATGTRTLGANGIATLVKGANGGSRVYISGTNLT